MPNHLVHIIGLILEGTTEYDKISNINESVAINIAQLIRFNAVKTKRRDRLNKVRHSVTNEPPLPVTISLMIYAKKRKKSIIENLAAAGLSITYSRVQEIQDTIGKQLCQKYADDGFVCPPNLKKGLFTLAAIDNIDHNPTSSTATSSFHGTSISLFQQVEENNFPIPFRLDYSSHFNSTALKLPDNYVNILPTKGGKPEPPEQQYIQDNVLSSIDSITSADALNWLHKLENLAIGAIDNLENRFSFSAFHSHSDKDKKITFKTISTLLPLLLDSINSPAMVRHCMKIVTETVKYLNPTQLTIITGDQPVYALGKKVQWIYSDQYKDVLRMMGPLHIEMAFLSTLGNWLDGSGWIEIFERAKISTTGRIESFLKGSKVKRTQYAHQVSLATLVKLSKIAFDAQNEIRTYDEWKSHLKTTSINAEYWFTVIELESLLFMFIKSLRLGDFSLFLYCLKKILPWFFALDHIQYSRWMPVFVQDLLTIMPKHEKTMNSFLKGYFTVKKTEKAFSNIGIDQAHEQNNKIVKTDGGANGILDNQTSLIKWAVAGPIISQILRNANNDESFDASALHHEDTSLFEKTFREDRDAFLRVFLECGNPFKEHDEALVHIISKYVLDENASKSVRSAKNIGQNQYDTFVQERLQKRTVQYRSRVKLHEYTSASIE